MRSRHSVVCLFRLPALIVYALLYVAVDAVLGIGSSILIDYRAGLAPGIASGQTVHSRRCSSRHRRSTGSIEAPALPWKSAHWCALALWRDYGWRVSLPLATAGYVLAQGHFPPYGAIAGLALGIAVWQYLVLQHRVGGQPSLSSGS